MTRATHWDRGWPKKVAACGANAAPHGSNIRTDADAVTCRRCRKIIDWQAPATLVEPRATVAEGGIYVASKSKHGPMWQILRGSGWPITSTWIDESGPGQTADMGELYLRCIREASQCKALVLYCEPGEALKGALIEAGAALASGAQVFAVGCGEFNFAKHPRVTEMPTVLSALEAARAATVAEGETRLALLERLLVDVTKKWDTWGSSLDDGQSRFAEDNAWEALGAAIEAARSATVKS